MVEFMQFPARVKSAAAVLRFVVEIPPKPGFCPVCEKRTVFVALGEWLREDLKCLRCRSSARQRAVIDYIARAFPALDRLHVYEPSPMPGMDRYLKRRSARYTWSAFASRAGQGRTDDPRYQDLQCLRFPDGCFDLVVSQDVFEHIADPREAFAEVARVLRPGGSHVFTVPWYSDRLTESRAELYDGRIVHRHPPEYHGDPYSDRGALVFTRFGSDMGEIIESVCGMRTSVIECNDPRQGIRGPSLRVFHSTKPALGPARPSSTSGRLHSRVGPKRSH